MQDTGNGSGQGWDKRAFSAQVAEWAIAVGDETGASVAHPTRPLRRGVGGLAGAEHARYRFREQLFPTMHFRLTYDALRKWRGDVEYVRILHLAATTMEATVDSALSLLLEAGGAFVGLSLIYRSRGSRLSSSFVRPAI